MTVDSSEAIAISAHVPSRTVVIGPRRFRAESIDQKDKGWSAWLKFAPHVSGRLRAEGFGDVELELWMGEPDRSKGVAVVTGGPRRGLVPIPLCSCGERECGHVYRQYRVRMTPNLLLRTIEIVETLPQLDADLDRAVIWQEPLDEVDSG